MCQTWLEQHDGVRAAWARSLGQHFSGPKWADKAFWAQIFDCFRSDFQALGLVRPRVDWGFFLDINGLGPGWGRGPL